EREIDQIQPTEPCQTPCQRYRKNLDDTTSDDEGCHHRQRHAANQVEFQSHNREVRRNKERERYLSYGVERLREQSALLVYDGESGKKGGEYHADIECPSDHTISEKNCNRIGHRRVFRDSPSGEGSSAPVRRIRSC